MDKVMDLDGRRYPYQGTTPTQGDVVAGFIVKRVTENIVYLGFPSSPEEEQAVKAWEQERMKR